MGKASQLRLDLLEPRANLGQAFASGRLELSEQRVQREVHRDEQLPCLIVKGVRNSPCFFLQPLVQRAQSLFGLPAGGELTDGLLLLPNNPFTLLDEAHTDGRCDPIRSDS